MVPLDHVLAVAVLITPLPSGETSSFGEYVNLARTLREVALFWEIVDPREVATFFVKAENFEADLKLMRKRYQELVDAPLVSDALRFPCRETASELLTFNREYHRTLKQRRQALGEGNGALDQALDEVEQLYHVWDLVRDARSDCYYISVRRRALQALRQALGEENYYRGVMPPHVPVWRFVRRD